MYRDELAKCMVYWSKLDIFTVLGYFDMFLGVPGEVPGGSRTIKGRILGACCRVPEGSRGPKRPKIDDFWGIFDQGFGGTVEGSRGPLHR